MMQHAMHPASSDTTDHPVDDHNADHTIVLISSCDDPATISDRLLPAIKRMPINQFSFLISWMQWRNLHFPRFIVDTLTSSRYRRHPRCFIVRCVTDVYHFGFLANEIEHNFDWFECECDDFVLTSFWSPFEFDSLHWISAVASVSFHSSSSTALTIALSPFEVPVVVSTTVLNIAVVSSEPVKSQTGVDDPVAFCK